MILPSSAKEVAAKVREYLPQFARPLLDKLIARVQFDAAGEILETIHTCRAIAATLPPREEDAAGPVLLCHVCERYQEAGRQCQARDRAATTAGARLTSSAAFEEIRRQYGPHFDQIPDVAAFVREQRADAAAPD